MAAIENLNIDEHKTLHNNRDKIVDLIFNHPRKYLNEELFEKLCNNDELTNEDINRELIKDLYFENLEIDEIYYLEQVDEILVGEEDKKLELGETSNRPILNQGWANSGSGRIRINPIAFPVGRIEKKAIQTQPEPMI